LWGGAVFGLQLDFLPVWMWDNPFFATSPTWFHAEGMWNVNVNVHTEPRNLHKKEF
jgi:hypothetical protein